MLIPPNAVPVNVIVSLICNPIVLFKYTRFDNAVVAVAVFIIGPVTGAITA